MRNIIFMIIILWGLTGCGKIEMQEEDIKAAIGIECGAISGKGVIYEDTDEYLIILTAAHVLELQKEGQPVRVAFSKDKIVQGIEIIISETSDIAFVKLSKSSLEEAGITNWKKVTVDKDKFDAMKSGDNVFLEGGREASLKENWIYVEDFSQYMMLVKGEGTPGMSGGGLYDEAGNLVGILCGVNEEGETAAVPLSIIMAEYAQYY